MGRDGVPHAFHIWEQFSRWLFQCGTERHSRRRLGTYLSANPKVVDGDAFADILERQGWTPNDLQTSLARLRQARL